MTRDCILSPDGLGFGGRRTGNSTSEDFPPFRNKVSAALAVELLVGVASETLTSSYPFASEERNVERRVLQPRIMFLVDFN